MNGTGGTRESTSRSEFYRLIRKVKSSEFLMEILRICLDASTVFTGSKARLSFEFEFP